MKGTITNGHAGKARSGRRPSLLDKWLDAVKIVAVDRIRSNADYDRVTAFMEEVITEIGGKKKHPLCGLMDILEMRLREYDESRHPMDDVSGVEMLRFLMDQHGLRQQDLPELGSQGVVSEILHGRRELNLRHITALARRFKVAPEIFLPADASKN
jgi:HTH-type transcriptional regulator / antitoxin HigA